MPYNILTDLQRRVLTLLFDEGIGNLGYFFTGGTALAEFYLKHRYSDDLDFFTRRNAGDEFRADYFHQIFSDNGLELATPPDVYGEFIRFYIRLHEEDQALQIDFARQAGPAMGPHLTKNQIVVDSFEDIAVNKICAIYGRDPSDPKDYVDLYFILEESEYTIDYLLIRAKEKEQALEDDFGILEFGVNLSKVDTDLFEQNFLDKIRMIRPLNVDQLRSKLGPIAEGIINRYRPQRN